MCSITLGALILVCAVVKPSHAITPSSNKVMHSVAADKRQAQSISEDWHNASAVCFGKLRRASDRHGAILVVTEVLKGEVGLKDKSLPIPLDRHLAGIFPNDSDEKPAIVFFSKDKAAGELIATEIYNDSDKISATRCLSSVFDTMSEKQALQALSDMVLDPSSRCKGTFKQEAKVLFRKELLAALNKMRDKNNFSLVTRLYDKADQDTKRELLDWMACTGDRRSLPLLIAAVSSPDRALRSTAISRLTYYYPGDAGVDDCIEHAYEHGFADTKNAALDYIAKRRNGIADNQTAARVKTPYQQAEEFFAQKKYKEATALYIQEVMSNKKDSYVRRWSALKAIPYASTDQKDEIRISILPLVAEDAATGNYLEATDAAEILQKLNHEDCLKSMIILLDRKEPLFGKANRMVAFGIAKLPASARHKASTHLLEVIRSDKFKNNADSQSQLMTLLQLIWISDARDLKSVDDILKGSSAASIWTSLHPLLAKNEHLSADFLLGALKNNTGLPHLAKDWIIVELGDLKDSRAADLILAHMKEMRYQYDYNVASDALKSIGGKHVCEQLEQIAFGGDDVSRNAVDILCAIEAEKSLPVLRRIIHSQSGSKTNALVAIARLGTPDDLKELVPLSDYWTGDRLYHYWIMEAIGSIRQRNSLNVNGPIKKLNATDKEKSVKQSK